MKMTGQHWYAIETRPKGERKALRQIQKAGIEAYLPEYRVERFNRRLKVSHITVRCHFPRYLFALMAAVDFGALRFCDAVSDVLPGYPMSPMPVDAKDVIAIREAEGAMLFDQTDEARRRRGETAKHTLDAKRKRLVGKLVRVKDGPFTSYHGEVEAVDSLERLRVSISIFGRETPVELESGQIEELAA